MERPDYTTRYTDRHGKVRWRFRYRGLTRELPEQPGHPAFDAAYEAALLGLPAPPRGAVVSFPVTKPKTLRACFEGVQRTADWKGMTDLSRDNQIRVAERFLSRPVGDGADETWGEMPITDLKRRHVTAVLGQLSGTPHAAQHVLRCIRKLVGYALDQEWIEADPTHRLRYRPRLRGHRAWTPAEMKAFEKRWPTGTTPRLVYTLALWTGSRRSDLARIEWTDVEAEVVTIEQRKTGMKVVIDALPPLLEQLEATARRGPTILVTQYGRPFSEKSLTGRFRDWTTSAGLDGCTLHGLRKTVAVALADEGATAKQIQAFLGHTTLQQADLYTKEADRRRAAKGASDVLRRRVRQD